MSRWEIEDYWNFIIDPVLGAAFMALCIQFGGMWIYLGIGCGIVDIIEFGYNLYKKGYENGKKCAKDI